VRDNATLNINVYNNKIIIIIVIIMALLALETSRDISETELAAYCIKA